MDLMPKNKQELMQTLQKQKDFKVETVLKGAPSDLATSIKLVRSGQYTVIVIKD